MLRITGGALVLALLVPMAAQAQQPRRPMTGPRAQMPNVARALVANRAELGLDDAQVARLQELARESDTRREELRSLREQFAAADQLSDEDRTRLRTAVRSAMEAERDARQGIRSVLTVEQFDRAARLGEALRSLSPRGERMRAAPAGPRDRLRQGRRPGFERRGPRMMRGWRAPGA